MTSGDVLTYIKMVQFDIKSSIRGVDIHKSLKIQARQDFLVDFILFTEANHSPSIKGGCLPTPPPSVLVVKASFLTKEDNMDIVILKKSSQQIKSSE